MRVGKRACRTDLYKKGTTTDRFGNRSGETLWKTLWSDIVAERGAEITISGEREVQTYLWCTFDYLDLCEGRPPKLVEPQVLAAMRLEHDGVSYDVDSIRPDLITKRDVRLRLVQKSGGN